MLVFAGGLSPHLPCPDRDLVSSHFILYLGVLSGRFVIRRRVHDNLKLVGSKLTTYIQSPGGSEERVGPGKSEGLSVLSPPRRIS